MTKFDNRFLDNRGFLSVKYEGSNFRVGPDTALIKLQKMYAPGPCGMLPDVSMITVEEIAKMGVYGFTHILDCSSDDPLNFGFLFYGPRAQVEWRRNFGGKRVGEATWRALREFGCFEYSRVKTRGVMDLSDIHYSLDGGSVNYRRLILPLSDKGREVTHLLVCIVHDKPPVIPGAIN